jgi:TonB family protein
MAATPTPPQGALSIAHRETANDRFKQRFGAWLWAGIILSTVVHFALLRFFPTLRAADLSFSVTEFEAIDLPPEVDVPPPPEAIARPAVPIVAQSLLEEDITIAPTTFEENPVENLPPPPSDVSRLHERPVFTPYTVAPKLRDPARAAQILERNFPDILQRAGIGGTVLVWAFVDQTGAVKNCQIHTSSGNRMLDEAALEAVREFEFLPALNYDKHVPVWVSLPLTFNIQSGR